MTALDAKYHSHCLVSLYNRAASVMNEVEADQTHDINHGIALAELVAYIEDSRVR